tara:strand:+ start:89 stop:622 length:534 start_codon:yes stop_codon:yes gene_type:complete
VKFSKILSNLILFVFLFLFVPSCDDSNSNGFDALFDFSNNSSTQVCDEYWSDSSMSYFNATGDSNWFYFFPSIGSNTPCSAELQVYIYGDFGSSNEYASVYINGDYLGDIGTEHTGYYCDSFSQTFQINSSDLQNYLDDGEIFVNIDNSSSVSSYCGDYWYYEYDCYHSISLSIGNE